MSEINPFTDLTYAKSETGDAYDFSSRAILARQEKEALGLAEFEPLPSPWTVEFEPTLFCNARCHFCSYEEDIAAYKQEQKAKSEHKMAGMSKQVVMDTLDSLANAGTTRGIFWSGGGDPLVWRPLGECLQYSAAHNFKNSLQTNGILLNKLMSKDGGPGKLDTLDLISVSVYADESNLHRTISGVNTFKKVVDNISNAIEIKKRHDLDLTVGVKIMVDAHNYTRISDIYNFYESLGVDVVALREVQDFNYGGDGQRSHSVELTQEQRYEMKEKLNAESSMVVRNFVNSQIQKSNSSLPVTGNCYNATDGHFACIDARGDVYIGNPEIGQPDYGIGNILEEPWKDIWGGDRHRNVIEAMNDMQISGMCSKSLCRHIKANVGVESYVSGDRKPIPLEIAQRSLSAFL